MGKWISICCCLATIAALAACGQKSMIVLVPDPDGTVGEITVSNAAGSVDIDQAHQSTIVRGENRAPAAPTQLDPKKVEKEFAQVLSTSPPAPLHFMLYFESDSVSLLPSSRQLLPEIIRAIGERMPTRVSVVGHSDTLGDKTYNLNLSMRRAKAVKQQLVDAGIGDARIDVSSHGEENPLVKTGDNVANAKNRRVEVVVR